MEQDAEPADAEPIDRFIKKTLHQKPEKRKQIRREMMEVFDMKTLRKRATALLKTTPRSRPAYQALLEMRGAFDAEMAKKEILDADPSDPAEVAPIIARRGHPAVLCRRQATEIKRECLLGGSGPEVAERAARELRRAACGQIGPVAYSITKAARWPRREEEIRLQIRRGRARIHLFSITERTEQSYAYAKR